MNFFQLNIDTKRQQLRESILKEGTEAINVGNHARVEAVISKATEEWLLETAEWIRGHKAYREKDFPLALEHFEKALKLDPSFNFAYNSKVGALIDMGKLDEAIETADYAIQHLMLVQFASYHYNKGVALERLGRFEEALYCYFRAIEDDQNYEIGYHAILNILRTHYEWPKFFSTNAVFREKIKDKPDLLDMTASILLQLTETTSKDGKMGLAKQLLEEAGNYLKIAVEKAPENPSIRYNLACFYSRSGNKDEAFTNLKKTLDLSNEKGKELFKKLSSRDVDFANIREDSIFKELISSR